MALFLKLTLPAWAVRHSIRVIWVRIFGMIDQSCGSTLVRPASCFLSMLSWLYSLELFSDMRSSLFLLILIRKNSIKLF